MLKVHERNLVLELLLLKLKTRTLMLIRNTHNPPGHNHVTQTIDQLSGNNNKSKSRNIIRISTFNKYSNLSPRNRTIDLILQSVKCKASITTLLPLSPRPCSQTIVAWCFPLGLTTWVLPYSKALLDVLLPVMP